MQVNEILVMNRYNVYLHEITKVSKYRGTEKEMCTHFNIQNICLNNLFVYLRFNFGNVRR
jgi:hypothetical protein